jgi:hypothetical protein
MPPIFGFDSLNNQLRVTIGATTTNVQAAAASTTPAS